MGRENGFTIIEVLLFLAISSLLFLIAISYMSGTIENVRFQDSVKTTESYVQKQFSNVQTNSVTRPTWSNRVASCDTNPTGSIGVTPGTRDTGGNSASCSLLGVELIFRANTIEQYPVLGYAGVDRGKSTIESLKDANPKILTIGADGITPGPAEVFTVPWGGEIEQLKVSSGTYNSVAILRSPSSESINVFFHQTNGALGSYNLADIIDEDTQRNIPAVLCISRGGAGDLSGAIAFSGKQGSQSYSISNITSAIVPSGDIIGSTGLNCL